MITVHYLENSQAIRIVWLLEELGLDYDVKLYKRDKTTKLAPENFKRLHPFGTSPVIETDGKIIAETNVIVDYILDQKEGSSLRPERSTEDFDKYNFWFHASQASLMPMLFTSFLFHKVASSVPFFLKPILEGVSKKVHTIILSPRTDRILFMLNQDLAKGPWLCGEQISAADIVLGYSLKVAEARVGLSNFANCRRFLTNMEQREAYKRAVERVGGFTTNI
ncbi:MAG: glutathione S-transferase [Bdellovibrionota bacterium]|nr:glutathione S-transferase [Bdellovibrionota bacterium]